MSAQDGIAFLIVAVAGGVTLRHGYRKYGAPALANFFLKRGKVRLAMRIRGGKAPGNDCGGCD
jgi:hypothetical protein